MSGFNLLPWREQRRQRRIRSWQWGIVLSCVSTVSAVVALDMRWDAWLEEQQTQQQHVEQTKSLWQNELKADLLWQQRARMVQQVQADWDQWHQQQTQAWQLMRQWLSVPPRGIQIDSVVWRDQQWQVSGWAISAGHWQNWQTALTVAGFSPHTEKAQWSEPQWRQTEGLSAKQHLFQLTLTMPATTVKP